MLKLILLLLIISSAASCKTCNCPAYSYNNENKKAEPVTAWFNSSDDYTNDSSDDYPFPTSPVSFI